VAVIVTAVPSALTETSTSFLSSVAVNGGVAPPTLTICCCAGFSATFVAESVSALDAAARTTPSSRLR
jgi:hypothetical protein